MQPKSKLTRKDLDEHLHVAADLAEEIGEEALARTLRALVSVDVATRISDLGLPARAVTCLHAAGVWQLGELLQLTEGEVLRMRNLGRRTLKYMKARLLIRYGLQLRDITQAPDVSLQGNSDKLL